MALQAWADEAAIALNPCGLELAGVAAPPDCNPEDPAEGHSHAVQMDVGIRPSTSFEAQRHGIDSSSGIEVDHQKNWTGKTGGKYQGGEGVASGGD